MILKVINSKAEWVVECGNYVVEWAAALQSTPIPQDCIGKLIILDDEGRATDNYRWLKQFDQLYVMNDYGKTIDKYTF